MLKTEREHAYRICFRISVILVPRAYVSFGHVVGETEGSGSSNYRMSVDHGHPVAHAQFLLSNLLMLRN